MTKKKAKKDEDVVQEPGEDVKGNPAPSKGGAGSSSDPDSAAIGDGPSGGAPATNTGGGDSSATGAGPSGGA